MFRAPVPYAVNNGQADIFVARKSYHVTAYGAYFFSVDLVVSQHLCSIITILYKY